MKSARAYDQTLRAQKAADTEGRILDVAERMFTTELLDRVTLDAVAKAAEVSIPTLQRRFGNKDGLFQAVGERWRVRIDAQRGAPPRNDPRAALRQLVDHYEAEGRLVWNLLRQEQDVPMLQGALTEGRAAHRAWVEAVFVDGGRPRTPGEVDALVAATDLFVWKLLRLDLGRSRDQVEETMLAMASSIARGK